MWRTFDVGDVVALLPFGDRSIAAGATGMGRKVRRARLAAAAEDLRRVGTHELVITTAVTLAATGEQWEQLIARLDIRQVSGIVISIDTSVQLPGELLAAADRAGLPLITFPGTVALADVTAIILDALLEAQGQRLDRVLDIHQQFTRIVAGGGGTVEVATTLHNLLGIPVAVIDAEGRQVVVVPSDMNILLDDAIAAGERRSVHAGDHDYGQIVALTGGVALDDDGVVALERASMAITVRLAQASAVAEAAERFAAISLEELIAGHVDDAADVAERANSFGWDLNLPRAVLLASVDPPIDDRLSAALRTIAAAARATLGRDAIVWTRSATIAVLIAPDTDQPAERRRIAERLRTELDQRLRSVTVSIGVGRRVDTPLLLRRSFIEASRAVDVGRWAKGRHVTEVFDQLGLERLLAATPTDDLAEFVEHAIGALIAHDVANRTDLAETLGVWLEMRNMAEAARRIHVHYNTFKNRLERIESILGPVLSDPARSLECEVAIYIARHYDGPWTAPPAAMSAGGRTSGTP
jgi:purine catabolism regulator